MTHLIPLPFSMQRINDIFVTRKSQLANATQRAIKAESSLKGLELLLADRKETADALANEFELKKERNRLNKELLVVLQNLEDARKKLALVEEKEKRGNKKVQLLDEEVDSFESKYRRTKKLYEELIGAMDMLGIN